jgi:signal transduction histidine kinase
MHVFLYALYIGFITSFILIQGALVFASNRRDTSAKLFFALSFVTSFWVISNSLAANFKLTSSTSTAEAEVYADLFSAIPLLIAYWYFVASLKKPLLSGTRVLSYFFIPLFALGALFIVLNGKAVRFTNAPHFDIIYQSSFSYYGIFIAVIFISTITWLIRLVYQSKGADKERFKSLLWGIAVAGIFLIFANVLYPLLFDGDSRIITNLSYSGLLLFIYLSARAIFLYQLFNIRFIVARVIAYAISIGFVTSLFIGGSIFIGKVFFDQKIGMTSLFIFALISIFTAISYQPVKTFFDKVSNRLFYQDAYDPQLLLNALNKTLVSTVELEKLVAHVTDIISRDMKIRFCNFEVYATDETIRHSIGKHAFDFNHNEKQELVEFIKQSHGVVRTDDNEINTSLQKALRRNNVDILAPLEVKGKNLGYMLLGPRRSGSEYSNKDMQVLSIIVDEVSIALQNALWFEEIKSFNQTLQKKINIATHHLQQTNEKLKELDETKDEFISLASHQLRTPLTSVKGYLSMLLEGDAGKVTKQQQQFINQAFLSSQRMVYLISDLLNVSRLKTGKFVIEKKEVLLSDVVESEISQLKEMAAAKSLKLLFKKPKDFPVIMLDETKIRQVIVNFIDNAIYYTPSGGAINVTLEKVGSSISFKVVDSGIGVPKEEQHKLFVKFYRAPNAKKARPDGTGLGLFMAKKVIVAQGGALLFSSTEGKGSTFGFTFPIK